MKAPLGALALLVSSAIATPTSDFVKRQADTATYEQLVRSTQNGVRILPRLADTPPTPGTTRTTKKYGTWSVSKSRMMSTVTIGQSPCTNCLVTAMEATIRYPDGREANVDTGGWLHHIALFGASLGGFLKPRSSEPQFFGGDVANMLGDMSVPCGTSIGQPDIIMNSMSGVALWAAGNERPTLRLNNDGRKYGLEFPSSFGLMVDLMSETTTPLTLTLEITFEHVPKNTPGYKPAEMKWLQIGTPRARDGRYCMQTRTLTSYGGGELLYSIGHMHDGGTDMELFVEGKSVCKSIMHYNKRPGYTPGPGLTGAGHDDSSTGGMSGMGGMLGGMLGGLGNLFGGLFKRSGLATTSTKRDSMQGMDHISDPGACVNFGTVAPGGRMFAQANYDANAHPLMVHNGQREQLMGNMRVYIGPR